MLKLFQILISFIYKPSHLKPVFRDLFKKKYIPQEDKTHLDASISWLAHAQDVTSTGGCSGVYTFAKGWTAPYPETTGYIIPTLIKYGEFIKDSSYFERAKKMADWEISIQLASGAVRGGVGINEYPIVFNTGQVMLGWTTIYAHSSEKKYLDAAIKAANWLVDIQDEDGKWSKNTYNQIPHAYNVRVTWAVLKVYHLTKDEKYLNAATKNINWVLSNKNENDWFNWMGFKKDEVPLTHTIAYTLRGLLESSKLLSGELQAEIQKVVIRASTTIMEYFYSVKSNKSHFTLPGTLNENWKSPDKFSCLTGNAQMAIIWLELFKISGEKKYFTAASDILEDLKQLQNLSSQNKGIKGGIAGSYPVWGKYVNFGYPNWAAKFFADALMLKAELSKK